MRITGAYLRRKWRIPVEQARYRETGNFFMPLKIFPRALCDSNGYVVFETEEEYKRHPKLRHGSSQSNPRVWVIPYPGSSISGFQGYIKISRP